ncbi:hypothetical protein DFR59_12050 [Falsibacillus pallidus]|uniref:Uncharacterized protein n=1 Tax=Falsibacillus pallidus TaxID=493781 RepID=A0A370G2M5_9BACI|nr:hypothetical protein DFR59_12050 [Falsibacillus pallidus]
MIFLPQISCCLKYVTREPDTKVTGTPRILSENVYYAVTVTVYDLISNVRNGVFL